MDKMDSMISGNGINMPNNHSRNTLNQGDRTTWEYHTIPVSRVPGYGFGIAVSGGRDNPHFANGDPAIAVSDVLRGGPAEDRLQVNDRIISVNGISLENVDYDTAVQVLRDNGNTVMLVIKRRVPNVNMMPISPAMSPNHQHSHSVSSTNLIGANGSYPPSPQNIKLVLTKNNKKDDFGIVLGCRLFIKEISSKTRDNLAAMGCSLREGDIVNRIQNTNCNDSMSIKEAKKIIDGCKDRLHLVVSRDSSNQSVNGNTEPRSPPYSHAPQMSSCSNGADSGTIAGANTSYSSQNLYVSQPTRSNYNNSLNDDKSNLTPRGRSRGPLMEPSLAQLDRPPSPLEENSHMRSRSGIDEPPRPPPPRGEEYYSTRKKIYDDDPLQRSKQTEEARFVSFQKEGSVGIRLTGGNEAGIFVTAVQPGSPASLQGLTSGDKLIKVNDMDMHGATREEAVLFLLSLQDRIDLIVQFCKEEYDNTVANQRGDNFHVKAHFHYNSPTKGEMAFNAGDIFRVVDTLHNGVVGAWQVFRIGQSHQEMQKGVIPNKSRAEELATAEFNAKKKEFNLSESRGNFFKRRRTHFRSKSLSRENWDEVVFSDSMSKFPAYERVVLRHPGFVRAVVIFGPIADLARERLVKDFPDKFALPLQDNGKNGNSKCGGIVRLSNIRDIMDRGKHALLDVTPNAVDRLNYAQFYPIVIFLKTETKYMIKQIRHGLPKSAHKSSKKLFEQCQKLDKLWSHVFSTKIVVNDADSWYRSLRDCIDQQQSGAVWMSETKPVESLSDDFLFPMNSNRLSYASSPESDLEIGGPSSSYSLGHLPQLVKASSDPSIATNQDNFERDREMQLDEMNGSAMKSSFNQISTSKEIPDNKNLSSDMCMSTDLDLSFASLRSPRNSRHLDSSRYNFNQAPDLPPRIDRSSKPNSQTNSLEMHSSAKGIMNGQNQIASPKLNGDTINGDGDQLNLNNEPGNKSINGTYDSVSSYDSNNITSQLTMANLRLGPNAPDDLKSVPSIKHRELPPINNDMSPMRQMMGQNKGMMRLDHMRSPSNATEFSSSNRTPYGDDSMNGQDNYPSIMMKASRPNNLELNGPPGIPRKPILETKTDYGKYNWNNSIPKNEMPKSPMENPIGSPKSVPFKPVPPPKPKNYRPPVRGGNGTQMNGNQMWDYSHEVSQPQSNEMFYPQSAQTHYHRMSGKQVPSNGHHYGPPAHNNGSYPSNQQMHQMQYNDGNNYTNNMQYGNYYMQRGPPPIGNIPPHLPMDRHGLDLAGSREQRGSAFELYRKPQIGQTGHHHNMSNAGPHPSHHTHNFNEHNVYNMPLSSSIPPTPSKIKSENSMKSPLHVIKSVFLKTTKPLRRQFSLSDNDRKQRKLLKRQHSMMERNLHFNTMAAYSQQQYGHYEPYSNYSNDIYQSPIYSNEQYYPPNQQNPYEGYPKRYPQNPSHDNEVQNDYNLYAENQELYANRALIDLQRAEQRNFRSAQYGNRLVRRHSIAGNGGVNQLRRNQQPTASYMQGGVSQECLNDGPEDIYQTSSGALMVQNIKRNHSRGLGDNQSSHNHRREMHLNHLYQSRQEMQNRILRGRRETERSSTESPNMKIEEPNKEPIYESRRVMKDISPTGSDPLPTTSLQRCKAEAIREDSESDQEGSKDASGNTVIEKSEPNYPKVMDDFVAEIEALIIKDEPSTIGPLVDIKRKPLTSGTQTNSPSLSKKDNSASIHISNILKRTAPPPPLLPPCQSITSIDTQYTSNASLSLGMPNAQSTPFTSNMNLGDFPVVREPSTTRGVFDESGGTLCNNLWNVSLHIPKGAIPPGVKKELYFTVTDPRNSNSVGGSGPPLDMENGEAMLSPLVMCGPQGTEFLVPVTLSIPHCAARTPSLGISLKATDSEKDLQTNWDNIELPSNAAAHTVTVKVDHF